MLKARYNDFLLRGFVCFILVSTLFLSSSSAQVLPKYNLDDVVVTAGRTPISFSNLTRSVTVITEKEIKEAPVNSVQGLLQFALGVDLKQRGVDGVQGDVSIRGGTAQETLILIDGIKVNDPQTAHHNLNIPVALNDVKRIEILKGQGSSIYGPNAFSGVINIITKKGFEKSLSLQTVGGQNGYYEGSLYGAIPIGVVSNHISFSKKKSDGYRHNTNFDILDFSYNSSIKAGSGNVNLFFGYNDKKYGANGFYTTAFPNQWEHTTTKFANVTAEFGNNKFSISPKIYWRRNDDNYLLDYENPSFYQNIHQTNIYGAEIQSSVVTDWGTTSFGGEYITDKIQSTNLGDHSRERKGIFVEQNFFPAKDFIVVAGAFAYNYSTIGWRYWPSLDLGYHLTNNLRVFGSVGKAFRIPTYTELYYSSPASVGNPNLQHEETTNFEIGLNFNKSAYDVKLSLFRKEGKNLIDWVSSTGTAPWYAKNISSLNTNGIEFSLSTNPTRLIKNFPITKLNIDYTYLNSDKQADNFVSQYLLEYCRNQLIISLMNNWWVGITQNWSLRYENRVNFEDQILMDTQIQKRFSGFTVFVKATNLFNETYHEISGVPLPGRWIFAGAKYDLNM